MAYTLADLLDPPDEAEVTTTLLGALTSLGFPVSSWPSGGVGRTLVQGTARVLADALSLVSNVARGALLDLAPGADPGSNSPGDWLTLNVASNYTLGRRPAQFAVVKVRLTVASGAGPYTVTPGGMWAKSPAGRRYNSRNASNVTLTAGPSTADIELRAELAGASGNVGVPTAFTLETPLPGVTAVAVETEGGSGTAMVLAGSDQERDAALRDRARGRWATLGLQKIPEAYDALARQAPSAADPNVFPVTRTKVDNSNPRGPGTVDVWFASDTGPLDAPDEAAVAAYLQERMSVTADLQAENAESLPLLIIAVLQMRTPSDAAVTDARDRVTALINATPIGGTLYLNAIIEELMAPAGVVNVLVVSPVADTVLEPHQVVTVGELDVSAEQLT